MRYLAILSTILFGSILSDSHAQGDLVDYRKLFHTIENRDHIQSIIDLPITESNDSKRNIIQAYKAVCIARLAEYAYQPISSYRYFSKGKNQLEDSIKEDFNIEIVYLRILVQTSVPRFLNYNDKIDSDLNYFKNNLSGSNIPELTKQLMLNSLMKSDLGENQKNKIKDIVLN